MPLLRPPDGVAPRVGLTPGIGISAVAVGWVLPPALLLWQQSVVICCSSTGTNARRASPLDSGPEPTNPSTRGLFPSPAPRAAAGTARARAKRALPFGGPGS
ncbi:hypothetical protein [Sorangium sp. So ce406]|uniref:hypothetical protein n=1 Tax=Sorangium sp. So ce406 TaxID=3133311 RepID=UPI003F5B4395